MLSFISNRNLGRAAVVAGLLAASVASGQGEQRRERPKQPGVIEHIEFPGGTLESFVEHLQAEGEVFANVLYRNGAKSVEVPAIELQNVHFITAINATILDIPVHFQRIQTGGLGSEVTVFTGREQADSTAAAESEATTTEILHVANLFGGSEEMDEVLEAIDAAVFDERHPERQPDIRFHKPSGLLIVRGSESQVDIVKAVVEEMDERSKSKSRIKASYKLQLNRLESLIDQYRIRLGAMVREQEASEAMLKEVMMQHDAGVVTKREVEEARLKAEHASANVELAALELRTAEKDFKLVDSRYDEGQSSMTYEYSQNSGARKSLMAVLDALRLLEGPPISIESIQEGEMTLKASKAEHAVIAAVLDAIKTAAGQGQD